MPEDDDRHAPSAAGLQEEGGHGDATLSRVADQLGFHESVGVEPADLALRPADRLFRLQVDRPDVRWRAGGLLGEEEDVAALLGEFERAGDSLRQIQPLRAAAIRSREIDPRPAVLVDRRGQRPPVGRDGELLHVPLLPLAERSRRRRLSEALEIDPPDGVEIAVAIGREIDALSVGREGGVRDAALSFLGRDLPHLARRQIDDVQVGVVHGPLLHDEETLSVAGEVDRLPGAFALGEPAHLLRIGGRAGVDVMVLAVARRARPRDLLAVVREDEPLVPALAVGEKLRSSAPAIEAIDLEELSAANVAQVVDRASVRGELAGADRLLAKGELLPRSHRVLDEVELRGRGEARRDQRRAAVRHHVEQRGCARVLVLAEPLAERAGDLRHSALQERGDSLNLCHAGDAARRRVGRRGLGEKQRAESQQHLQATSSGPLAPPQDQGTP